MFHQTPGLYANLLFSHCLCSPDLIFCGKQSIDSEGMQTPFRLAKALDLRVVAEGVETWEQLSFLSRHGCDRVQGYLLGRPVGAGDFAATLDRF